MLAKNTFKCDRFCGKCCMNLAIRVAQDEISKIKNLGFEEKDFLERDLIDESKFILKKKDNGHCIFLKKSRKGMYSCGIYKNRPRICQKYPFFGNKPLESCYPEDLYPEQFFSFKAGKFAANNQYLFK